jgi:hypothetical protein
MATVQLNMLSRAQLNQAVQQIIDSRHFWARNSHIQITERARVRAEIIQGQWPDFPVFSPYAATHDGYSQSKFTVIILSSSSHSPSSLPGHQASCAPHHLPPDDWQTT